MYVKMKLMEIVFVICFV